MKLWKYSAIGVASLLSSMASAQTVDVPSISGSPGDTVSSTISFTQGAQDIASWQIDIQYDRSNLGIVSFPECPVTTGATNGTIQCSDEAGGAFDIFRVGVFTVPSAVITSGDVAIIEFTIPMGTPPGTYPMIVDDGTAFFDLDANEVTDSATVNVGEVTVVAPAGEGFYTSNPPAGTEIDFGGVLVNATTPDVDLGITNASPDTDLEITAFDPGHYYWLGRH